MVKNRNLNINFDMKLDVDTDRKNSMKKYLIAGIMAFTVSCSTIKIYESKLNLLPISNSEAVFVNGKDFVVKNDDK